MNTNTFIRQSYSLSILMTIIGAILKINHHTLATPVMAIGLILLAIFIIAAIYEVMNSSKIGGNEKFMWIIGFLFFGSISGFVYLVSARKRIIKN